MMTDPVSDMLTRVRNALKAHHEKVEMPSSKMKKEIAKILKDEGFIKNYKSISDQRKETLTIFLRYDNKDMPIIHGLNRLSKPSRRFYVNSQEIPKIREGMGVAILSTSKGIMTDRDARIQKVGGELICSVW
jgi:small subunit ribosomal protein S8